GMYATPDENGRISEQAWDKTFAVNVKGGYLAADETGHIWKDQGLPGRLVITTSVNGVVAKKGSFAYDTSKAAANHLVRELAIELAPLVNVNAVAPATVVEGSSMFPRERVLASLKKYNVEYDDKDDTNALRTRLAGFYANRTLTQKPITLEQQTEAIFLLLSSRFENTTGHTIPVDGGLVEAFLR
ncbi:MAG: SDR family oxidoreductase, partial [Balneolales bacterium]